MFFNFFSAPGLAAHHHIVRATTGGLNPKKLYMYKLCVSPEHFKNNRFRLLSYYSVIIPSAEQVITNHTRSTSPPDRGQMGGAAEHSRHTLAKRAHGKGYEERGNIRSFTLVKFPLFPFA
ncbi:hypothetical protein [Coleofasciculus sp. H7-2]|uniref:hypothetical protein n=1 Tax=Coleofasciculus sp. H7-2 TaxID=3351545 RepID=UPI00366A8C6E